MPIYFLIGIITISLLSPQIALGSSNYSPLEAYVDENIVYVPPTPTYDSDGNHTGYTNTHAEQRERYKSQVEADANKAMNELNLLNTTNQRFQNASQQQITQASKQILAAAQSKVEEKRTEAGEEVTPDNNTDWGVVNNTGGNIAAIDQEYLRIAQEGERRLNAANTKVAEMRAWDGSTPGGQAVGKLDTDQDGTLTPTEVSSALTKRTKQRFIDKNNNGVQDEGEPSRASPIDTDGDGQVSEAELIAAREKRVNRVNQGAASQRYSSSFQETQALTENLEDDYAERAAAANSRRPQTQ